MRKSFDRACRRSLVCIGLVCAALVDAHAAAPTAVDSARAVFQRNLDALARRDVEAYRSCYRRGAAGAVRVGSAGFTIGDGGLDSLQAADLPDVFEAAEMRLAEVSDGVVFGTYRYRVRFGDDEQTGISERTFVRTPEGWKIAVTSAFPAPPGQAPPPRAIVGATLIDGTGKAPVRDALVVVEQGRITYAGPRRGGRVPAGADTVDARGAWVLPGLGDAHVHFSQTGWADGRPDALDVRDLHPYEDAQRRLRERPEAFFRSWLACGVTSVFDVGGYPWTVALQQRTRDDAAAPRVVAAGPLLSTLDHWLNLPAERQFMHLRSDSSARAGVAYLKSLGAAAVKVWFIPNGTGRDFEAMAGDVAAAGRAAREARLPLIVHATGLREAKAALRAGAKLLVHSVWDAPVDAEFLDLMRRNRTIYCPTLTVVDGYVALREAVRDGASPLLDDPHGAVDSLTRAHVASSAGLGAARVSGAGFTRELRDRLAATMAANLARVHRAGIPIAMGTDAGNPLTLHGPAVFAEMEAMQRAGMPPMAVLVAATRGAALAMGEERERGTLERGKAADLILTDADPTKDVANLRRLRAVMRRGVLRSADELSRAAARRP